MVKNKIKVKGRVKEMWCDQSWADNEVLCRLLTNSPKFTHCPNQFCKLPFERIPVGKSKGTPVVVMVCIQPRALNSFQHFREKTESLLVTSTVIIMLRTGLDVNNVRQCFALLARLPPIIWARLVKRFVFLKRISSS